MTTGWVKNSLNFLLLNLLRHKEMQLLTLIDETLKLYQIELETLIENTSFCKIADSWRASHNFKSSCEELYMNFFDYFVIFVCLLEFKSE